MSSSALVETETSSPRTFAEYYLLLGELRMLLNDAAPREGHQRWLLAVLDRLLAFWPQEMSDRDAIADGSPAWFSDPAILFWTESTDWWRKLQRLRDRVAHRTPYQFLANEIRCDLQVLFNRESQ